MKTSLSLRDLKHFWHPCAQMKDFESAALLEIASACGCYLYTTNGKKIFDAISSWWCKNLGHGHPRLQQALRQQAAVLEHVMMGTTTHESIVRLSEQLAALLPSLSKVWYASDGSSAIDAALKMSLHAQQLLGRRNKRKFASLSAAYHGETVGALSVSDVGIYKKAYQELLFSTVTIEPVPYLSNQNDPRWYDCEAEWKQVEQLLTKEEETLAAIIIEPIVQGAGGMKIYSADFLKRLRLWTKEHGIHLIADEIMTGLGRTGKMLACEHASIEPDFICLSKGLTAGFLPMSALITTEEIYNCFYDDYEKGRSFLHSHTFSGHVLAAAVASETMSILQEESLVSRATVLGHYMQRYLDELSDEFSFLQNTRSIGAIAAAEIVWPRQERLNLFFLKEAENCGVFLRPIGNTLYWTPPLNTPLADLEILQEGTRKALKKLQSL